MSQSPAIASENKREEQHQPGGQPARERVNRIEGHVEVLLVPRIARSQYAVSKWEVWITALISLRAVYRCWQPQPR